MAVEGRIWYNVVGGEKMPKFKTTVYIDLEDKRRLEVLSEQTLIPEARLWREALELLFERRSAPSAAVRSEALRALRTSVRTHKIQEAYETYKREEKRREQTGRR
jgi:predicted DNA-binding protein